MRLNIGCGEVMLADWLNVDIRPLIAKAGYEFQQGDIRDLSWIATASVDEVRAFDVLEHVGRTEVIGALKEVARVLVPGGTLTFQVPCIHYIAEDYLAGKLARPEAERYLYGHQDYPENTHMSAWDARTAIYRLGQAGLRHVSSERVNYNLLVSAEKGAE